MQFSDGLIGAIATIIAILASAWAANAKKRADDLDRRFTDTNGERDDLRRRLAVLEHRAEQEDEDRLLARMAAIEKRTEKLERRE